MGKAIRNFWWFLMFILGIFFHSLISQKKRIRNDFKAVSLSFLCSGLKKFFRKKHLKLLFILKKFRLETLDVFLRNEQQRKKHKEKIKIRGKIGHHEELMQTVWREEQECEARDKIALKLAVFFPRVSQNIR